MSDSCFICGVELHDGEFVAAYEQSPDVCFYAHAECVKHNMERGDSITIRTISAEGSTCSADIGDADEEWDCETVDLELL